MQLLPLLVAVILGASALAFVLYPLYRQSYAKTQASHAQEIPFQNGASQFSTQSITSSSIMNSSDREQTAKAALQEIELDYQLGNLGEADYHFLKERYMRRAILAMKSRQNHEQELDELIEAQLRRMKEGKVAEEHDEE
jgi:Tfp pilus assembly protein PilE